MSQITSEQAANKELLAAAINNALAKMSETMTSKATKEDWAKLVVEFKELHGKLEASGAEVAGLKKEIEKAIDAAKVQGEKLNHVYNTFGREQERKSFRGVALDVLKQKETAEALKAFYEERVNRFKMEVPVTKVAFSGTYGSGAAQNPAMPFTVPAGPDYEMADIRTIVPTGTIEMSKLDYPSERAASRTDNLGFAAGENAETTASAYGFTMTSVTAVYIKDHVKVSRFALRDTAWLSAYLQNQMFSKLVAKLNSNVITGTGGSNDLNGLLNNANTFAGTGMSGAFPNADYFSVLTAARAEMGKTYKRRPNTVILDPVDAAVIADSRSTIGSFLMNPYASQSGAGFLQHMGMAFTEFADMTDGGYLVADLQPSTVQLLFNGPIEVLMSDSDDDNFTKDLITLKIGANVMLPIYNTNALLKGTLATDRATIISGA